MPEDYDTQGRLAVAEDAVIFYVDLLGGEATDHDMFVLLSAVANYMVQHGVPREEISRMFDTLAVMGKIKQ